MIDTIGNLEFLRKYTFEFDKAASAYSVKGVDNGYVVTGWSQRPNYKTDVFVLKTGLVGEMQWLKYYGHPHVDEAGFSIIIVDSNEYVVGGHSDTSGYIFAIDSIGNLKWQWIGPDTGIAHYVVRGLNRDTTNGDWVYLTIAEKETTHPDAEWPYPLYAPVFVRRDSMMRLKHAEVLGPFAVNHWMPNMIPSRDGGWIGVGVTSNTTDEYISELRSWQARIVKLDKEGKLIWSAQDKALFHPVYGSNSYMHSVEESPTGSIYAAGFADNPLPNGVWRSYGWLLKITADGCIDTLCTTTSLLDQLERMQRQVSVYPNPATDYLIFDLDQRLDEVRIEIFDLNGRRVQSQRMRPGISAMMLDMARITSGIYIWRLMTTEGRMVDVGKFVVK